jgi:hypothetical protein
MMQRSRFPIVTVLMALTLAGCGGTDDTNDANGPGGPGADAARSAAPAADADISIPLAEGAEAVSTSESGPLTIVQYTVPLDRQAATIAFYDEWTAARSDDYERVEAESGGVSWQNAPAAGGEKHIIAVLAPLEGDDFVTVTLTVGPAE